MIRIGHGYDLHRLTEDQAKKGLKLGGIQIPYSKKFVAHSDGDVLVHALIDALLGAAGLGDIGQHFPDTDPKYKGCDSLELLDIVMTLLKEQGYRIHNGDITVIAQKPKLAPYISFMREILCTRLEISLKDINIKAKTNEQCDAVGKEEAIAVFAVVTLVPK